MKITTYTKKDGSTVYRTSVFLGVDQVTGKKVNTTVSARTKRELDQKARRKILDFEKAGSTVHKAVAVKTYQELAELWWESYQHTVKSNTQDGVRKLLNNHILPAFGTYRLDKLTPPLIQGIINKIAKAANEGQPGAYLHYDKIHGLNKRILQYGVILQALPYNPAREVILPRNTAKADRQTVKHWENDQLKAFLDYLGNLDLNRYRYLYEVTLYKFLLATGCRINEALALDWSDIDLEARTVNVTKTLDYKQEVNSPKSKASNRIIDIDQATCAMLHQYKLRQVQEAWQLGRTETVVFSDFIHAYPNNRTLQTRLRTHFKRAGMPNIGFHGFRHTHASLLLNSGIPYKELQHRLGHSTLSMTMDIYSHLSKEKAKSAVSFFEKALKSI
ncbi:integrase/recombinase [Streptococcus satellite phage Javan175]|uniref:tyrosine-type recombinase/integrase n=1 Tax=Streptococcus entericus TaxID=155680 RepID=UPI00038261BC|nr:site-specific integrase [Streptococcus entericus]QBX07761.1 integrase/recombinase [Streptococcus satellite phage Javan175]